MEIFWRIFIKIYCRELKWQSLHVRLCPINKVFFKSECKKKSWWKGASKAKVSIKPSQLFKNMKPKKLQENFLYCKKNIGFFLLCGLKKLKLSKSAHLSRQSLAYSGCI